MNSFKDLIQVCVLSRSLSKRLIYGDKLNKAADLLVKRTDDLIDKLISASKNITELSTWINCLEEAMGSDKEKILKKAFKIKEGLKK